MLTTNLTAFKEWASIGYFLGKGEQILILRKGGIHEKGKKFDVAYEEFFLFPTFEHQKPEDLKPEAQKILNQVFKEKPKPDILPIQYYCVVEDSFWISDEKVLAELNPYHFWSWDCIKARFEWGDTKGLFGITARTYSFPKTILLENLKRYGGCRSWVELEKPLSTALLKPVLSERDFQEQKEKIAGIVKSLTPAPKR